MKKAAFAPIAAALLLVSTPSFAATPTTFHEYVALGDSITAGFQAGCLVERHQRHDYAQILATQIGIADFEQPLFAEGPLSANPAINKCLGFVFENGSITVGPVSDMLGPENLALPRPYDNLGLPGATAEDLVTLTNADPNGDGENRLAAAILRNTVVPGNPLAGTNALQQTLALQPDLVTVWIGSNDVLGAALSGVALEGVTLTPTAVFQPAFQTIVSTLAGTGRTLVLLNISDVTALPFATTIPPVVVDPTTSQPVLVGGQPVPLLGPGNAANPCPTGLPACPLPAGTLVTLLAQPLLEQGYGIPCAVAPLPHCDAPLPDGGFVPPATLVSGVLLYPDEVAAIQQRTNDVNGIIASVGASAGAVLVDIHAVFDQIKTVGYPIGGITLTPIFGTGGLFSADGFHPNNIAHGLIADTIIRTLDAQGSQIPEPNLNAILVTPDVPPAATSAREETATFVLRTSRQMLELFGPVQAGVSLSDPASGDRPRRPGRSDGLVLTERSPLVPR